MTISGLGPHGERAAPPERVSLLPDDRAAAKAAKSFTEADRIRQDLLAQGVVLKDSATGTTWERS